MHVIVCVQNPATYFQSCSVSTIIRRNNQKATQEMKESWRLTPCITPFSCNPQKTAWGVNTDWLSVVGNVLLFILSFSVLLYSYKSFLWGHMWSVDFILFSHTHVSSYLPLMFHCHGPAPRSPEKTISRQRKINKEMHVSAFCIDTCTQHTTNAAQMQ